MRSLGRVSVQQRRHVSAATLWRRKYELPKEGSHAVEALLDDVGAGLKLLRGGGSLREASAVLERALEIAAVAFGPSSESSLHVRNLVALACFNAGRFAAAEKHLRGMLAVVDATSAVVDRFEVRVLLAASLRQQGKLDEAAAACAGEPEDSVEQRVELLARRAWLELAAGRGPSASALLNEAAAVCSALEHKSASLARYGALILALQGVQSLTVGRADEALARAKLGQRTLEQYRQLSGDARALAPEMGDVLTVQGQALVAAKRYLEAEETLDEALAQYEPDSARSAQALLALGQLFKETSSNTYAEGAYRKLLSMIARNPGEISSDHIREVSVFPFFWFVIAHFAPLQGL